VRVLARGPVETYRRRRAPTKAGRSRLVVEEPTDEGRKPAREPVTALLDLVGKEEIQRNRSTETTAFGVRDVPSRWGPSPDPTRPSPELLYLPVPLHVEYEVKPLIDLAVYRGGTGIGGILLLVAVNGLGLSIRQVGFLSLGGFGVW